MYREDKKYSAVIAQVTGFLSVVMYDVSRDWQRIQLHYCGAWISLGFHGACIKGEPICYMTRREIVLEWGRLR